MRLIYCKKNFFKIIYLLLGCFTILTLFNFVIRIFNLSIISDITNDLSQFNTKEISKNLSIQRKAIDIIQNSKNIKKEILQKTSNNRNDDWEQLNFNVFFKRTSAFYLFEKSLLRIFFVSRYLFPKYFYNFLIEISVNVNDTKVLKIILKNGTYFQHDQTYTYRLFSLNHLFNLKSYKNIPNGYPLNQLNISIIIKDITTSQSTLYPIFVKIKSYKSFENRTGSAICSKCYFYSANNSEAPKYFDWWFKMNKRLGYKKIYICNNSIPNTLEFNEIFNKYQDYVKITHLKSLPNFISNNSSGSYVNHSYLSQVTELKYRDKFESGLLSTFDTLILNECYLDNYEKYKYIAVIDNDELIMPRDKGQIDDFISLSTINCSEDKACFDEKIKSKFKSGCTNQLGSSYKKNMDDFILSLKKNKSFNEGSLYFKMGFYLDDFIISQTIEKFEIFFRKFNTSKFKNFTIEVHDLRSYFKFRKPTLYAFEFKSKDEIDYARNLCKLYRFYIEPFNKKFKKHHEKLPEKFNRFFYVSGKSTEFAYGKTIHNTRNTLQLNPHLPVDSPVDYVDSNQEHVSHFREDFNLKEIFLPVRDLLLDINYLFCYYKDFFQNNLQEKFDF